MGALLGVASQLRPPRVSFDQLKVVFGSFYMIVPKKVSCALDMLPGAAVLNDVANSSHTCLPPRADRHELRGEARKQRWKYQPLSAASH